MMSLGQKRSWLVAIILRCPFSSALDTCPLAGLRQLDASRRMDFVDEIRPNHIARILEHHKVCLLAREAVEEEPGFFDPHSPDWKLRSCPAKTRHLDRSASEEECLS